jgi:AcrR family transcriptional regulator
MNTPEQLRPGRNRFSREEVARNQRDRIFGALETVMSQKGYLETSVADVIKTAGVSRQTFYELFSSKQDCFLASFALRQRALIDMVSDGPVAEAPLERFSVLLRNHLTAMAADPALSRLYLVGVYAAGPEAVVKRLEMQRDFVDGLAIVLNVHSEQERFTCQALVATIVAMVTNALVANDPQAVRDLHEPVRRMAELLLAGE